MTPERFSAGPFGDVRVLELADVKGEWCGKLMADLGADVIKIEPPGGAPEREIGPFYHEEVHPERSLHFWHYNTSKRGVTLNIETEDGRALFRQLVATADVLLETTRPGYLASLGLGYEQLRALNPRLVMCSLTDFGQTGPWRDYLGSDLIHLAAGGQMESCGYSDEDVPGAPPIAPGGGNGWHMGSHYAYIAIVTALIWRSFSGKGQYIDTSVHGAAALTTEMKVPMWIYSRMHVRRQTGRQSVPIPTPRGQFLCKDGKYITTGGGGGRFAPPRLRVLAEWMDQHGFAEDLLDEQYADAAFIDQRQSHIGEVLERFCAGITSEQAYHGAQQRGFVWGAVRAPEDIVQDPHWDDRGFWTEVAHPELGETFTYPGASGIYSASPWQISRRAPLIGEHNEDVFGALGVDRAHLAALREAGAV